MHIAPESLPPQTRDPPSQHSSCAGGGQRSLLLLLQHDAFDTDALAAQRRGGDIMSVTLRRLAPPSDSCESGIEVCVLGCFGTGGGFWCVSELLGSGHQQCPGGGHHVASTKQIVHWRFGGQTLMYGEVSCKTCDPEHCAAEERESERMREVREGEVK
jgi:hypothetical protein